MKEDGLDPAAKKAPLDWFESPTGARVMRDEVALARLALDDVFGFELLQVGAWGPGGPLLGGARTQHTTLVAPRLGPGVTLCAPLATLPFASDTIDAILLPHTLELAPDPYAVLREAERVLCADGCLMIAGFNPWSGWGARRLFNQILRRPAFPPGTQRLLSERRLRDWVALLGFDVDRTYGYLGMMPIASGPTRGEFRPSAAWRAGAYLLKARKRVQTMTLVRPKRRVQKRMLVAVPSPAAKSGHRREGP
jgi:SAM-dependent methyltransferase